MSEGHRTVAAAAMLILARTNAEREAAALGMVNALVEADEEEYAVAYEAFCRTFPKARSIEPLLMRLRVARLAREAEAKAAVN